MEFNLKAIRNNPLYKLLKKELEEEIVSNDLPDNQRDALNASTEPSLINPFVTFNDIADKQEFDGFISQTGELPPTVLVRRNTYGGYSLVRSAVGTYEIVFEDDVLIEDKTAPNGEDQALATDANGNTFTMVWVDVNTMRLSSKNSSGVLTDGLFVKKYIYFNTLNS